MFSWSKRTAVCISELSFFGDFYMETHHESQIDLIWTHGRRSQLRVRFDLIWTHWRRVQLRVRFDLIWTHWRRAQLWVRFDLIWTHWRRSQLRVRFDLVWTQGRRAQLRFMHAQKSCDQKNLTLVVIFNWYQLLWNFFWKYFKGLLSNIT